MAALFAFSLFYQGEERGGEERRGRNLAVNLQFLVIFKIRTIFL
jgi:hypothetical protein